MKVHVPIPHPHDLCVHVYVAFLLSCSFLLKKFFCIKLNYLTKFEAQALSRTIISRSEGGQVA